MASIRERPRKDGTISWAVLWRDADTGKQTSRTLVTLSDAQELADFLNANGNSFALAAEAASRLRSTAPTTAAVVRHHIDSLTGVSSGTRKKYGALLNTHIAGHLGAIPVDRLTRDDVATWLNTLALADKTKRNVHSLLSAALAGAVRDELVTVNAAKGLRIAGGAAPRREPVFLSKTDVELIVDHLQGQAAVLVRVLADTGLRWSEATALRPVDLDLTRDHGVVTVTRAWKETAHGWAIGEPKTRRGRRSVVVPRSTTLLLREHTADTPRAGLVFTGAAGGRLGNARFHTGTWQPLMTLLERRLPGRPSIHDLRHTHASWLIAAGIPLTVIQRRLGHESIKTTSDTYGHLAAEADIAAAAALD